MIQKLFFLFIAAILIHQPAQEGIPESLDSEEVMYYFDQPNKRIAINNTFQELNSKHGKEPALHIYTILDYGKVCNFIVSFNTCCCCCCDGGGCCCCC